MSSAFDWISSSMLRSVRDLLQSDAGTFVQQVAHVEDGATYRLTFSIADADGTTNDDGVRVMLQTSQPLSSQRRGMR